jgi:serine/threonine protein kinase
MEACGQVRGYRIIKKIGEGSYGSVHLAESERTGERVAIKYIPNQKKKPVEVILMQQLHHKHIVQLLEVQETAKEWVIIMQLAESGDMLDRLQKHGYLEEREVRRVFRQLLEAVRYAHVCGYVHRDIKACRIYSFHQFARSGAI